jgi:D-threo-aldose 1-dehydrogenase
MISPQARVAGSPAPELAASAALARTGDPVIAGTRSTRLGSSRIHLTPLGLGALWIGPDVEATAAIVNRALDHGIGYFDTAPSYSEGLSEVGLGAALATIPRDRYALSTKVGRLLRVPDLRRRIGHAALETFTGGTDGRQAFIRRARRVVAKGGGIPARLHRVGHASHGGVVPAPDGREALAAICDFSYDGVMTSIEESLTRLGLDRIDLALIHDPDFHHRQAARDAFRALDALRSDGTIGAIGVGMNRTEPLVQFAEEARFDAFLVAGRYSLLDQSASERLFKVAAASGVSIILGGVFNGGLLADPVGARYFDYLPASSERIAHARRLKAVCDRHAVSVKAAALQFSSAHPAVTTTLLGASSVAELDENVALLRQPIPAELWVDLERGGFIRPGLPVPVS